MPSSAPGRTDGSHGLSGNKQARAFALNVTAVKVGWRMAQVGKAADWPSIRTTHPFWGRESHDGDVPFPSPRYE